jgi:hypothetical protein
MLFHRFHQPLSVSRTVTCSDMVPACPGEVGQKEISLDEPTVPVLKSIRSRAISSAGEHCLHTAGVAGSNPASPTMNIKELAEIG